MSEPPEPYEAPEPAPARQPRRILALGGLGLVVLGVLKLAWDALHLTRSEASWLPILSGAALLVGATIWRALDTPEVGGLVEKPPTEPRLRAFAAWAVVVLVVAQSLIPLRYYTGDDAYDERFSWRMFSAVRVNRCNLAAYDEVEGRRTQVNLMQEIHVGWVTTMRRNREAVMRRYLSWRCETEEIDGARLTNVCVSPEGNQTLTMRAIDCASGTISDAAPGEGGAP